MESYIFVLIMHLTAHAPNDVVLSAWTSHEQCLVVAGLFAEDDQRIQTTGATYSCKKVPLNTPPTKK
jgi:hypothetical protein